MKRTCVHFKIGCGNLRNTVMSRYDSHLRRLERKVKRLEQQRISGNIGKALREYGQTGELPLHAGLRHAVLRIINSAQLMKQTMPGTIEVGTPPHQGKSFPPKKK
jgi:hypothetical protein